MKNQKSKVKNICLSALYAALICVVSVFSLPVGNIPFSLTNFAVMLCAFSMPNIWGVLAVAVYLLLGICGIPVFAGFNGGFQVLLGASGGFIIGYLFLSVLCVLSKKQSKKIFKFLFITLGFLILYALGCIHYCILFNANLYTALLVCVAPFIVFDIIKTVAAFYLAKRISRIITQK